MGSGIFYTLSKLSEINFRMAIHPGDANRRLASQAENIALLFVHEIPDEYQREFDKMVKIINSTLDSRKSYLLVPYKIHHIRNVTAAKFIHLLISIEDSLRRRRDAACEEEGKPSCKLPTITIVDSI